MAGSKRGGARSGAGRPKGRQSTATRTQKATLSELAREHTETVMSVPPSVAKKGKERT